MTSARTKTKPKARSTTKAGRRPVHQVPHPSQLRRDYTHPTSLGYRAATEARRGPHVVGVGGSADFHLRYDRDTLVKISRGHARNSALFQGIHRAARDNILGGGFALQAKTTSKRVNVTLEKLWKERCKRPEIRGLFSWKKVMELVLDGIFVAGDIAGVKLASRNKSIDGKLQLIESEQIDAGMTKAKSGNRIEGGVELDKFGRIVRFYVKDFAAAGSHVRGRARKIAKDNVIFPAFRSRPSQTRGVPPLVASFPDLERLDDILSSEAASWQLLSRLAVKRTQNDAAEMAIAQSKEDDNKTLTTEDLAQRVHDIGHALIFNCEPGEDIEGIEHNVPGPHFESSVRMFLRLLGLPLGLPLELILLDWSQTNYSSARAALEQAYVTFARWQCLLIEDFCTPDYEWQVRRWVAEGRAPDRPDIARHEWIRPQFPWLDQLKEAQAWGMKLDRGLVTHAEALKSLNRDRGDFLEARVLEIDEAFALAEDLGKKYPKLDVRAIGLHLCGLSSKTANTSKKGTDTPTSDKPGTDEGKPKKSANSGGSDDDPAFEEDDE